MDTNSFINDLVKYCEFEPQQITGNTMLKSIEGYDSLAVMAIIAFAHQNFGKKINASQIQELTDINSLMNLMDVRKSEK